MSLQNLPVELLYEIFMYGQSENLPLVSQHFYAVFKSAPTSVLSQYLISRHYGLNLVVKSLRYPFCDQHVLEAIFRGLSDTVASQDISWATELPRRLFRSLQPKSGSRAGDKRQRDEGWTRDDYPLPFLRYIDDHPRLHPPNMNAWDGYALTKAVAAGHTPLIRFLLEHGANPGCKGGLAVKVAIQQKDLELVKLLIERDGSVPVLEAPKDRKKARVEIRDGPSPKGKTMSKPNRAKKRRLEDRLAVTQDMLKIAVRCDARSIVEYFMNEKGCVPDMQTIMMMSP
ncbi:unnamed protein product [Somion occarium]|uniref:Uncharacterized protein n=1 Tax=Somion occarium TaxID=3059160 RepID=A0ABP1EA21_9APHY